MLQLLNLFVDICLFRRGPQDVPASLSLMYMAIAASLTVSTISAVLAYQPGHPAGAFLVTLALLMWLVILLLRWRRRMDRLKQTFTALFGSDALLTAIGLPLAAHDFPPQGVTPSNTDMLLAFLALGLLGWSLAVMAHILRHALDLPLSVAGLIAIGWVVLAFNLVSLMFGGVQPSG